MIEKLSTNFNKIEKEKQTNGISNFWFLIILILTIFSFIYLFKSRTISEIITYTLFIGIPIEILTILTIRYYWNKNTVLKNKKKNILFLALFFILIVSMSYYALAVSIKDTFLWVLSPTYTKNFKLISIIVVIFFVAFIFFIFRLRFRSLYGISEAVFGFLIAGNKIITENNFEKLDSGFFITILTASVYLVVRGFDNIHQGITKDPIDPIATKILNFLKKS